MSANPPEEWPVERSAVRIRDFYAAVERARVLARIVAEDPTDLEARAALEELRREGFDPVGSAYALGASAEQIAAEIQDDPEGDDTAWVQRLLTEADACARVGLAERAADLLRTVLRLDPRNDVARARLFELAAKDEPRRGDETIRIRCR